MYRDDSFPSGGDFLWHHIAKSRKANNFNFACLLVLCMPLLVRNFKSIS